MNTVTGRVDVPARRSWSSSPAGDRARSARGWRRRSGSGGPDEVVIGVRPEDAPLRDGDGDRGDRVGGRVARPRAPRRVPPRRRPAGDRAPGRARGRARPRTAPMYLVADPARCTCSTRHGRADRRRDAWRRRAAEWRRHRRRRPVAVGAPARRRRVAGAGPRLPAAHPVARDLRRVRVLSALPQRLPRLLPHPAVPRAAQALRRASTSTATCSRRQTFATA